MSHDDALSQGITRRHFIELAAFTGAALLQKHRELPNGVLERMKRLRMATGLPK